MINTSGLSFYYGKTCVLANLDLAFHAGFNVLLGPNGAGKSTFIALLTHLKKPSSGYIEYDGLRIDQAQANIMARFGVVFQEPTLDMDLTVEQNLCYHGALHGLSKREVLRRSEPLLEGLGLTGRLKDKIRQLNGGHRKRLEIVRALVHKPSILLLDEASVGLDNQSRAQIINYIRELAITSSLCVIWTTHLLDEIKPDDHLVVLTKGVLVASGTVSDLISKTQVSNVSDLYISLTSQGALNAI